MVLSCNMLTEMMVLYMTACISHNMFKVVLKVIKRCLVLFCINLSEVMETKQMLGVLLLFSDALGLCPFGVGAYR